MTNLCYKSRKLRKIDKETGNTNFNKRTVTEDDRWWSIQIFNRGTGNRDRKFNFVAASWLERDRGRHSFPSPRGIRSKVPFKGCCSCSSYFFHLSLFSIHIWTIRGASVTMTSLWPVHFTHLIATSYSAIYIGEKSK